eukprot:sb/3468034/
MPQNFTIVVHRVFSQNLVDERGVPPGPLERYRKFTILSPISYDVICSLFKLSQICSTEKSVRFGLKWMLASCSASKNSRGRDTKIWYPGIFLTLNTMQASISIQKEQIFQIRNYRYLSSGPGGTPRSSTKFCEKTRHTTLTLRSLFHSKLDEYLEKQDEPLNNVVEFKVQDDVLVGRISGRMIHQPSGRTYHEEFAPPKEHMKDDVTGEPLMKRPDDNPTVLQRRLDIYHEQTAPLIGYYSEKGIVRILVPDWLITSHVTKRALIGCLLVSVGSC